MIQFEMKTVIRMLDKLYLSVSIVIVAGIALWGYFALGIEQNCKMIILFKEYHKKDNSRIISNSQQGSIGVTSKKFPSREEIERAKRYILSEKRKDATAALVKYIVILIITPLILFLFRKWVIWLFKPANLAIFREC